MNKILKISSAVLILSSVPLMAFESYDAKSLSMSETYTLSSEGYEGAILNPAVLGLNRKNTKTWQFSIPALNFNFELGNDKIDGDLYEKYFTTGDLITESDKKDIIDAVGDKAKIFTRLSNGIFGISYKNFSYASLIW